MIKPASVRQLNKNTLLLEWPEDISRQTLLTVIEYVKQIEKSLAEVITDCIPAYCSVAVCFDPEKIEPGALTDQLYQLEPSTNDPLENYLWELPVCYDPSLAPDLEALATAKKLSTGTVISMHAAPAYDVHFFGFLPGFMYLGGLHKKLHHPRKQTPDRAIASGSVAIGGGQTGIYPTSSPGGWHIIGNCPIQLFDVSKNPPCQISPGDQVRFQPIDTQAHEALKEAVASGSYLLQKSKIDG